MLATPADAAAPSTVTCEDGNRDSAKAVADTRDFVEGRGSQARATDPNDKTWALLKDHAAQFGFRQYAVESWHWDPLTTANRC